MKLENGSVRVGATNFLFRFSRTFFYCYGERELIGKRRGNRGELNK